MTNPTIALKQYLSNIGLDGDSDFLRDSVRLLTCTLSHRPVQLIGFFPWASVL